MARMPVPITSHRVVRAVLACRLVERPAGATQGRPQRRKRKSRYPRALPLHAWSGSRGVDAVVTAFVLAASRPSVSAPSDDRTDPSPMRGVRAFGEWEEPRPACVGDLLCFCRGTALIVLAEAVPSVSRRSTGWCSPGCRPALR
jgi:hypothetical protein